MSSEKHPEQKNVSSSANTPITPEDTPPDIRDGRKFAVSSGRGKGKNKIRYIETNDPTKGCRFL